MRQIAVVGSSPGYEQAPHTDSNWEIWVLGATAVGVNFERIDRIFELHRDLKLSDLSVAEINKYNCPVYVWDHDYRMQTIIYPFDDVKEFYRDPRGLGVDDYYFTHSFAYVFGLAIYEMRNDPGVLSIYGANMMGGSVYGEQKECAHWYLGIARGLGIEVRIQPSSDLLKGYWLYGKEEQPVGRVPIPERIQIGNL